MTISLADLVEGVESLDGAEVLQSLLALLANADRSLEEIIKQVDIGQVENALKMIKQQDFEEHLLQDILALFVQLTTIAHEQPELDKLLAKTTKDLSSLSKPALFVAAYPNILKEVNRRVLFN
jgi:hypothetical protein